MNALCSPYFTSPVLVVLSLPSCVAAVLVEKILRVQPDVKRIYLPVRAPDAESAKKRVETEVMTYFVMHFYIHSMISDTFFCSSVLSYHALINNQSSGSCCKEPQTFFR